MITRHKVLFQNAARPMNPDAEHRGSLTLETNCVLSAAYEFLAVLDVDSAAGHGGHAPSKHVEDWSVASVCLIPGLHAVYSGEWGNLDVGPL